MPCASARRHLWQPVRRPRTLSTSPQPPAEDRRRFLVQALTAAGGAAAFMAGLPAQAATIPRHNSSKVLDRAGIGVEANPLERMLDDLSSPLANDRISRPGNERPGLRRGRAAHGPGCTFHRCPADAENGDQAPETDVGRRSTFSVTI